MVRDMTRKAAILVVITPYIVFAELNGLFNGHIFDNSLALFWSIDALFNVLLPVIAIWFLKSRIRSSELGLAFPPPLAGELLGSSLFFALLLFVAYFVPHRIAWALSGYAIPYFSYGVVVPVGILHVPVVLYLALTAGIVESAMFLGLPWLLWREHFGKPSQRRKFALLSSIVFAAAHWEQGLAGLAGTFVFGLAACAIYFKIGDLWPVVGAHAVVDIVAFY